MDITTIFKESHGMVDENALLPLSGAVEEEIARYNLTFEDVNAACELLGITKNELFINENGILYPFCFMNEYFYHDFQSIKREVLEFGDDYSEAKRFKFRKNRCEKLFKEGKYANLIDFNEKKATFILFESFYKQIPKDEVKSVFLECYERNEYGFDRLNQQMVKEVLDLVTPKGYLLKPTKVETDEQGFITVYRGVTPKSSPLNLTYSWTLSSNVAKFFAERFDSNGQILKAKVHKDKIKAYISGRNEEEVLVFPEDIHLVEK